MSISAADRWRLQSAFPLLSPSQIAHACLGAEGVTQDLLEHLAWREWFHHLGINDEGRAAMAVDWGRRVLPELRRSLLAARHAVLFDGRYLCAHPGDFPYLFDVQEGHHLPPDKLPAIAAAAVSNFACNLVNLLGRATARWLESARDNKES